MNKIKTILTILGIAICCSSCGEQEERLRLATSAFLRANAAVRDRSGSQFDPLYADAQKANDVISDEGNRQKIHECLHVMYMDHSALQIAMSRMQIIELKGHEITRAEFDRYMAEERGEYPQRLNDCYMLALRGWKD